MHISEHNISIIIDKFTSIGLIVDISKVSDAIPDRKYRCGTAAKPKSKNGWWLVKYDGVSEFVTIVYGNFELGDTVKFKYHISLKDKDQPIKKLSPAERAELQEQMNARIEADRVKYEQLKQQKADYYVKEFNQLPWCTGHPYITR